MLPTYISSLGCALSLLVLCAQSRGSFREVCEPTSKEMGDFRKALDLIGKDDPTIDTINPKETISFSKKEGFLGGFYRVYFTLEKGTVCYILWRTFLKWFRKIKEESCHVNDEQVKEIKKAREKCEKQKRT